MRRLTASAASSTTKTGALSDRSDRAVNCAAPAMTIADIATT